MHDDAAFSEEELQILQRLEHKNEVFEASADPLSTWQSGWSEGWQEGARDEAERIIGNLLQLHAERELISQATGWSQAEIEAVRVQAEKGERLMYEKEMAALVQRAGALLTDTTQALEITAKGRANFVTQMDVAVQEQLRRDLHELDPSVVLLAEEQKNGQPKIEGRYWILDPIDGTQNFIRHLGLSAVSLAYYENRQIMSSVIYNPFTKELFQAVRGQGAFLNGRKIQVTETASLEDSLVAVGTSPYEREYTATNFALWQEIFRHSLDIRRSGSACLDLAYVAAGRYDCYFERNLKPWDMAAGILLVEEAQGRVTNYVGERPAIVGNDDICAGNVHVQPELLAYIQRFWHDNG